MDLQLHQVHLHLIMAQAATLVLVVQAAVQVQAVQADQVVVTRKAKSGDKTSQVHLSIASPTTPELLLKLTMRISAGLKYTSSIAMGK